MKLPCTGFCIYLFIFYKKPLIPPFFIISFRRKKNTMDFNEALASLNSTQRECVLSEDNTLQILAGPGSGKTRGTLYKKKDQ